MLHSMGVIRLESTIVASRGPKAFRNRTTTPGIEQSISDTYPIPLPSNFSITVELSFICFLLSLPIRPRGFFFFGLTSCHLKKCSIII